MTPVSAARTEHGFQRQAGPALVARLAGAGIKIAVEGVEHAFPLGVSLQHSCSCRRENNCLAIPSILGELVN
jgi:hypothetical protein